MLHLEAEVRAAAFSEVSFLCSASSWTTFFTRWSNSESLFTPFLRAIAFSGTSSQAEEEASPSVAEVNSRRSSSSESPFFSCSGGEVKADSSACLTDGDCLRLTLFLSCCLSHEVAFLLWPQVETLSSSACLKRLEVTLQASFAALAALEEVTAFPPQGSLIPPSC